MARPGKNPAWRCLIMKLSYLQSRTRKASKNVKSIFLQLLYRQKHAYICIGVYLSLQWVKFSCFNVPKQLIDGEFIHTLFNLLKVISSLPTVVLLP
jgi:hypothetical protein